MTESVYTDFMEVMDVGHVTAIRLKGATVEDIQSFVDSGGPIRGVANRQLPGIKGPEFSSSISWKYLKAAVTYIEDYVKRHPDTEDSEIVTLFMARNGPLRVILGHDDLEYLIAPRKAKEGKE